MQKLIGISIFIALFIILLLAYLYFKPKPNGGGGGGGGDDGDDGDDEAPKPLKLGKSYTIERNNLYLYFDSYIKQFGDETNPTIVKNVFFRDQPTTWTLGDPKSGQGNLIFCKDDSGTYYYLFQFSDGDLGCVKVNGSLPLISNEWYTTNGLSFNFELKNDKSYVIKHMNGYLENVGNIARIGNSQERFKITETSPQNVVAPLVRP